MGRRRCFAANCDAVAYDERKPDQKESFYLFPSNEEQCEKWYLALRELNNQVIEQRPKYARLCSRHFTEDLFDQRSCLAAKRLKSEAVPSVFVGLTSAQQIKTEVNQIPEFDAAATNEINLSVESKSNHEINCISELDSANASSSSLVTFEYVDVSKPYAPEHCEQSPYRARYPGDWSNEQINMKSPRTRRYIFTLRRTLKKKNKQIKRLQKQASRQTKKIYNLKLLIEGLKEKNH